MFLLYYKISVVKTTPVNVTGETDKGLRVVSLILNNRYIFGTFFLKIEPLALRFKFR